MTVGMPPHLSKTHTQTHTATLTRKHTGTHVAVDHTHYCHGERCMTAGIPSHLSKTHTEKANKDPHKHARTDIHRHNTQTDTHRQTHRQTMTSISALALVAE